MEGDDCIGAIVCKLDRYKNLMRGYIAMLDVDEKARRKGVGTISF
jgi:peptide alpha-N-acetyltransferase